MSAGFIPRKLLLPLVPAYRLGLWLRERRLGTQAEPVQRLRYPVVSIGNLSTGGSGKTPLTIVLATVLTQYGFHVDVLSRGYGRKGQIPARVTAGGAAEEFGDEPLLITRTAGVPVYVAAQRFDAGLLAEGDATAIAALGEGTKPVVHFLDDGFQHRQLARTVDILLLDRQDWTDHLLPAGNLREPISAALRATVIAIPAEDTALEAELKAWGWHGPVWRLLRNMEIPPADGPVAAFCGIARPRQFFAGLEAAGLEIVLRKDFPDHHRFTAAEVERLVQAARAAGASAFFTTEKDQVRLGNLAAAIPASIPLKIAGLAIEIENRYDAIAWLLDQLGPLSARQAL
ncbi:MAG TPA: tetraacyldisaccharide 4'-kinase [Terracidiphilus sp.]|jgi:tetraacyldisaccharide 4'-kinase